MSTPVTKGSHGRTRLVTIASIAAVTVAGAFAVAANIGILNATETNTVGALNTADLAPPKTQIVDVTPTRLMPADTSTSIARIPTAAEPIVTAAPTTRAAKRSSSGEGTHEYEGGQDDD